MDKHERILRIDSKGHCNHKSSAGFNSPDGSRGHWRRISMNKMVQIEAEILADVKKERPPFRQGDIVSVHYKIREKDKEKYTYHCFRC